MKIPSIAFLLGIAVFAHSEICPSSEELYPCTCTLFGVSGNIRVQCNGYKEEITLEAVKRTIKSLAGKTKVIMQLQDIKMGKVPSDIFKGVGLKRLDIMFCELDNLSDSDLPILAGLEDSLEDLTIHTSFKGDLPQLMFGHLKKLKLLNIFGNTIKQVSNKWFKDGPTSLELLMLDKNDIEELGDSAFSYLPNLKLITLAGNGISSIDRDMFPSSADHLKILDFKSNDLTNIPEDIFREMPKLYSVDLRANGIARVDKDTWESVWDQLNEVRLEENPLVCDSSMSWMFDLSGPNIIRGFCDSPAEMKGKWLEDFINNKGQ